MKTTALIIVCLLQFYFSLPVYSYDRLSARASETPSVSGKTETSMIKVHSSPTSEYLRVEGTSEGDELFLFDSKGQLLKTKRSEKDQTKIGITELGKGLYYLRYCTKSGNFTDKKILIL